MLHISFIHYTFIIVSRDFFVSKVTYLNMLNVFHLFIRNVCSYTLIYKILIIKIVSLYLLSKN